MIEKLDDGSNVVIVGGRAFETVVQRNLKEESITLIGDVAFTDEELLKFAAKEIAKVREKFETNDQNFAIEVMRFLKERGIPVEEVIQDPEKPWVFEILRKKPKRINFIFNASTMVNYCFPNNYVPSEPLKAYLSHPFILKAVAVKRRRGNKKLVLEHVKRYKKWLNTM